MTSRPVLGSSQRSQPPQRSLSSTNTIQRPPPHRTLSQQFSSSSPTRRNNEGFVDLTFDGSDTALGRYGTIPRNGGSRLKLEISKDSKNPDLVESPKPTSAATPTWKPSLPPRGRPQLHFDVPSISNLSPRAAQDGGQNEITIKPMPLPVRPGQHAPPPLDRTRSAPGTSGKKDARPKPYVLEVPAAAPHYSPNGVADFFPWTGNHPEDQFSDPVIRQGYFDKAQMTQNEMGSAKASIFPALKHKSGLQTLSSLFTSVLAQRRSHGQITSSSTFKPPPRVTVTDTKREMWLKDLANPTISLRRLSRSIPHGIRGKVLLDQSLSKNIPIERAVWLAKCVGANELRSFRRKGVSGTFAMGGEAKWIRDFTVCVEQFVESILGSCGGDNDFKNRINYALRLAAYFYSEYLLDREHYMDWLVSSLENSPQAKLPMWLLITQIYLKDLLKYRKYGRRLSTALLGQLAETLNHPDHDILAPLSDRLEGLIKGLMASNPESFVMPKAWTKFRDVILASLESGDERFRKIFTGIDHRNGRLNSTGKEKELSPRRRLIGLLDTTLSQPLTNELPSQCWHIDANKSVLIRTVLEWSTSAHRPGVTKTYVAARILRSWSRYNADISEAILRFLDDAVFESGRSKPAFHHLISELARSEHFSTPMYLQWLIARGGLYDARDVAPDGPCATRLLAELPTHNLSESLVGLRRTLLNRGGFSVDHEERQTTSCIASLNRSLPGMQANVDLELETYDVPVADDISSLASALSRKSKSEIGLWLRQKVRLQMLQPTIPPLDDWDDSPMKGGTSAITPSDFNTVRKYLELIDDYSMLADVLKMVCSSNDAEVLASCADTLNLHLGTFAAIGALKGLFEILMTRLRSLTDDIDPIPRVFLASLSDLAARMPDQKIVAQQLSQELVRSDRKTAADACSPVSDHMAGVLQNAEADFTDEIEKVLASGNSMDQATLERLFQRIVFRLEASWEKSPEQQRSCGLLLTRLRTFDTQQFDVLSSEWVNRFLHIKNRPSMMQVIGPLISFGCLALYDVIRNWGSIVEKEASSSGQTITDISLEALALILAPADLPDALTIEEAYRLRIKQNHMQNDHPLETLSVIRRALEESLPSITNESQHATIAPHTLFNTQNMSELLQKLILIDPDSTTQRLIKPLLQGPNLDGAKAITSLIDGLLSANDSNRGDQTISIDTVLNLADDLTFPFCQMKLAAIFNTQDGAVQDKDGGSGLLEALDNAIESAVTAGKTAWACIVPLLDIAVAEHLRQRAESQFLSLFPITKLANSDDVSNLESLAKRAENLLNIIDATAYSISSTASTNSHYGSSLAPEIVKTFNGVWLLLSTTLITEIKDAIICKWLPLLLSFATIHTSAFDTSKAGHENRAKALLALAATTLELQALDMSTAVVNSLIERTFDLGLSLVDLLPDDLRQNCTRSLRDAVASPRISYLFSSGTNPSEWLALSQKEKGTTSQSISANGSGEVRAEEKKLTPFPLRRWEMLGEPTPNVGENDTSLSLTLFGARRG